MDKSVCNDFKETYESFQLFESSLFDHQVLRRLVAFMYEEPATIIDYFKDDAIVAVDEYNRIKETETNLISEADEFMRSEEHTSELQSRFDLVCRLLLEKKKKKRN